MDIDWRSFTPWSAVIGGALIGLAAAVLILFNGRIAGVSGVLGGLLRPREGDLGWRGAFIFGLVAAPLGYALFARLPRPQIDADWAMLVVAGLLVGIGTRYGAGCTSGHGVCGVSRFSPRSLAATALFMLAGFATVYAVRHLLPL
ncbi:MAG TPA: YeeE/YedE family protein [Ramlibacter sp.]|jgi:uncharacterized membrane protein YedE/YeeE